MRVIVIGGSFAGMTAAEQLRKLLGNDGRVSIIDQSNRFEFRPSLPWLVFGQRRPNQISVPRAPLLRAKGIEFIHDTVQAIDPKENVVRTQGGEHRYDFLVLATGGTSPPERPPALAERGFAPLWIDEALRLRGMLAHFSGGSVVVALHPRSPLACAAYEYVFQLSHFLRERGLRERTSITMVTYEDSPFMIGGPTASDMTARWLKDEGIRLMTGTFVDVATKNAVVLANKHVLSARLLIYIPPFRGSNLLRDVPHLTDSEGFVLTDKQLRSYAYGNVFAAGDCVSLPGPKSALIAEMQAKTVATNIAADYGLAEHTEYKSAMGCMLDLGPGRGLTSIRKPAPQQGRTKTYFVLPGAINRLGKLALEQYFLRMRLRIGDGGEQNIAHCLRVHQPNQDDTGGHHHEEQRKSAANEVDVLMTPRAYHQDVHGRRDGRNKGR